MKEKIRRIQEILGKHNVDGWMVFCHHSYDVHLKYLLEKWFSAPTLVFVPREGNPIVLASRMEAMMINEEIFTIQAYKKGEEFRTMLKETMSNIPEKSKIALNFMEDPNGYWNYDIISFGSLKMLKDMNTQLEFIPAKDIIFDVRAVKTKKELENHKIASKLAEELMEEAIEPIIKPGMKEKEVAALIEFECNKRGGVAFEAIVASGANAAIPHHKPSEKKIENNQVLLIDYGVAYNWSNSDITRTYWIGSNPLEKVTKAYEAVDQAKEAAYSVIRAGVINSDVEEAVRHTFSEYGYDPDVDYLHSTGHPIGIETHDIGIGIHRASPERPGKALLENSVITVEPGLYFPDDFGIRLEDDCIVTKNGTIRLCNTPKNMKCL